MKITQKNPPREFEAGFEIKRTIKDCGEIHLGIDELLTFKTEGQHEFDVTRKDFGFYATPSLNGRLVQFGLKSALVKNRINQFFILLVEEKKLSLFNRYLDEEQMTLIAWLDDTNQLKRIEETFKND